MRKLLIILLIFCLCLAAQAWQQKPMLGQQINYADSFAHGLVGCWVFNEGAGGKVFDLSGNGNTGTLYGDTCWVPGKFGPCLSFDGTGDYVDLGKNAYNLGIRRHATFSHWLYPIAGSSTSGSISDWHNSLGFNIRYETGSNTLTFYVYPNNHRIIVTDGAIPNTWQHVVGVMDGDNMYLYHNGLLIGQNTLGEDIGNPGKTIKLSTRGDGDDYQTGHIDDVMIFNRALCASEIAHLYREPFCMFAPMWGPVLFPVVTPSGQIIWIMR